MTLWLQELAVKIPEMEGTNPPREKRSPGDHSPEGRAWTARGAARCKHRLGPSRKGVKPQNKTKRGKATQAREAKKHPCRFASEKKASEKSRENPRNAWGPEWHPDKTPEGKDARPKREINPVAAGTQTRKTKKHQVRVGVCPVTT